MARFAFAQLHPGTVLKEELEARGLSADGFALKLRVPPQGIQHIVAGRRGINRDAALRLEAGQGTPARLWLDMRSGYDLHRAEAKWGGAVRREVAAA